MSPSLADICWSLFEYRGPGLFGALTKAEFLQQLGLPDACWRGPPRPMDGYLELAEGGTVRVRFSDWDTAGGNGMIGLVVLAAEELSARGMPVPEELAAAATLALAEGAVEVKRRASDQA